MNFGWLLDLCIQPNCIHHIIDLGLVTVTGINKRVPKNDNKQAAFLLREQGLEIGEINSPRFQAPKLFCSSSQLNFLVSLKLTITLTLIMSKLLDSEELKDGHYQIQNNLLTYQPKHWHNLREAINNNKKVAKLGHCRTRFFQLIKDCKKTDEIY